MQEISEGEAASKSRAVRKQVTTMRRWEAQERFRGLSERNTEELNLLGEIGTPLQPQACHTPLHIYISVPSCVERQRSVHEENGKKIHTLPRPPSPLASMAPVADSSTRVDSPSHGLVTSSLCSPYPAQLSQIPQLQPSRTGTYKVRGGGSFF